jgi:hypothetical protein
MSIISNNWEQAAGQVETIGQQFLREFSEAALAHIREETPVKTGALRDHNQLEIAGDVATLFNDQPYAVPVEMGHVTRSGSHVPANPFFERGLAQAIADAPDIAARVAR